MTEENGRPWNLRESYLFDRAVIAELGLELFRRHRDRLWAVALRTMGDREDAADAPPPALGTPRRGVRAPRRRRRGSAVTRWTASGRRRR